MEKAEAIARLKKWLPAGKSVYTVVQNVSRSGMTRTIAVLIPRLVTYTDGDGKRRRELVISDISGHVAAACGWRYDRKRGGVIVRGVGMDMGFHLVYTLGDVLHGDGYALYQKWAV